MAKICSTTNCNTPVFSQGMCQYHWRGWKASQPLAQTDRLPAKPFRAIKKVSDKQAKLNTAYNALSTVFKKEHPICQAKVVCKGAPTTDTHHKRGRGEYLLDSRYYLAVCRACHDWIGTHHERAMELGLVESRLSK